MQVPYKEIGKICVSIKTRLYEKVMPSQFCSVLLKVLYLRLAIMWNSNAQCAQWNLNKIEITLNGTFVG